MKKKILSIDDSKAVHAYLDVCFADQQIELTHMLSGKEGIEVLKKNPSAFDLVLMDWEMPEMTGLETLKTMKSLGINCPVMMVTTKNNPSDITQVLEIGAKDYIMKPFTADIILQKINEVLGTNYECK